MIIRETWVHYIGVAYPNLCITFLGVACFILPGTIFVNSAQVLRFHSTGKVRTIPMEMSETQNIGGSYKPGGYTQSERQENLICNSSKYSLSDIFKRISCFLNKFMTYDYYFNKKVNTNYLGNLCFNKLLLFPLLTDRSDAY